MKDIAIYGAGGLGREIACMIRQINEVEPEWNLIGFFDDGINKGEEIGSFGTVLGGINEINNWPKEINVALSFGMPQTLQIVRDKIVNKNIIFPNLVHPSFSVGDLSSFKIGIGNIITSNCIVTTNIKIGNFNLLNGAVVMGHDVQVGDYNVFMPGARISGKVRIGNQNLLGAGCFVKQQVKIGNHICLSPLSALLTKPKDGNTYIGNPAKIFKF